MHNSKPLKQTWIFFALTLGLVFFVFWGPLALFGIPGPSLEAGNSGPPWAVALFVLGGFTPSLVALVQAGVKFPDGETRILPDLPSDSVVNLQVDAALEPAIPNI